MNLDCTFKRVDFPQPLGPRSIQNCPDGIRSEQSLRIGTILPCLVVIEKVRLRPSMAIFSVRFALHTHKQTQKSNKIEREQINGKKTTTRTENGIELTQ